MSRVVVVGAGIVGLAVAERLSARGDEVVVVEKEHGLAEHQTGRNSGVVHSGLYYKPGSYKATMSAAGAKSIIAFAKEHGIAHDICGKLVVATDDKQVPELHRLAARAVENGVPSRLISAAEAKEYEPHVNAVAALRVESTGIIDYPGVCRVLAELTVAAGGEIQLGTAFVSARTTGDKVIVTTSRGEIAADYLVTCAGLYSDKVAEASGLKPEARIIPFRGEYFELRPGREDLVRGLIYPVPDPNLPFLGVHLTRMINGSVHAGPNAVFALAREGYRWRDIDVKELVDSLVWPGLWKLGARNAVPGIKEGIRSTSRRLFARSLAQLVPEVTVGDLVPTDAGVRAQALRRDGSMVDDFLIQEAPRQVHVLNAPSPAATCSLEIADQIVSVIDRSVERTR
ncbi:L-2-hydroxyglutarate oxidase [Oerskovia enterophila]